MGASAVDSARVVVTTELFLLVTLGVLAAGLMAGITGFGFNLLSVPLLVLLYEPHVAVVISLCLGLIVSGALLTSSRVRRQVDTRLTTVLFVSSLFGLPLGVWVFQASSPAALKVGVGAVTVVYALVALAGSRFRLTGERYLGASAGFVSGLLATSTGLSGPPAILFVHSRELAPADLRATLAAYVFLVTLAGLPLLWAISAVPAATVLPFIPLAPIALVGLGLGRWVFRRIGSGLFDRLVVGGLFAMGLLNLLTAVR
ncbi:MAG TPA: sulfite exporter TauE/SafE family protein [Methylomirabilota bacterium]|nr:sulfite exporter TauE/SafE family protein [Methylomirabilota bacterium]